MPTWGQLVQELNAVVKNNPNVVPGEPSPHDLLRRKYLGLLSAHTGRGTIVYATSWLEANPGNPGSMDIKLGDVQAFMEACSNITEDQLDLLLTTPGGSPEAAESIVEYLRTRFRHIRVIVPVAAMSAGTMISLAADEIVMGTHSQLGPIDPQITVFTPEGPRSAPAQAIQDQFEQAKRECSDPANIGAWLPMLRAFLPGLLASCAAAQQFARDYAERVLAAHMFVMWPDAQEKAKTVAEFFSDFARFKSHGRRVSRDEARSVDLNITNLESDQVLQDLVLSVHHATRLSFGVGVAKLVENQHGRAYMESQQQIQLVPGPPLAAQPLPQGAPAPKARPAPGARAPRGRGGGKGKR